MKLEEVSEEAVDSAVGKWLEGMGGGEEKRGGGAGGSVKRVSEFNGAKSGCGEEKGHQISKGLARRGVQEKGGARVKRGQDLKMKQRSCVKIGEDLQRKLRA